MHSLRVRLLICLIATAAYGWGLYGLLPSLFRASARQASLQSISLVAVVGFAGLMLAIYCVFAAGYIVYIKFIWREISPQYGPLLCTLHFPGRQGAPRVVSTQRPTGYSKPLDISVLQTGTVSRLLQNGGYLYLYENNVFLALPAHAATEPLTVK